MSKNSKQYINYRVENVRLPNFDGFYEPPLSNKKMSYVFYLERDPLMKDLFDKITQK